MIKILIVLVATALLTFTPALADETKVTRMISISGHGEVRTVPDLASISLGVISSADTAQAALAANSKTMTDLVALLFTSGTRSEAATFSSAFWYGPSTHSSLYTKTALAPRPLASRTISRTFCSYSAGGTRAHFSHS